MRSKSTTVHLAAGVMLTALLLAGCSEETAPSSVTRTTTTPTAEVLDYFLEIALGVEFGETSPVIRKWSGDLRIQVHGNPTADDPGYAGPR